jgi:hypothetical protein
MASASAIEASTTTAASASDLQNLADATIDLPLTSASLPQPFCLQRRHVPCLPLRPGEGDDLVPPTVSEHQLSNTNPYMVAGSRAKTIVCSSP